MTPELLEPAGRNDLRALLLGFERVFELELDAGPARHGNERIRAEQVELAAHEVRDARLGDAQNSSRLFLCPAFFQDASA